MQGLRWPRIVLLGVGGVLANWLLVTIVIFGYAFWLGFQAMGPPDQQKIQEFARAVGPQLGLPLGLVLILVAGWLGARGASRTLAHGVAVGAVAGLFGLGLSAIGGLQAMGLVRAVLAVGAGALGGWLTRRPPAEPSPQAGAVDE